jgi:glycosyltransferase involved in cell wall biosynthesis
MSKVISIIPDRLAHYRVPVFDNIANNVDGLKLYIYSDLALDSSRIKKPTDGELKKSSFTWMRSRDFRIKDRLIISSGSLKSITDESNVVIIWGDAFSPGNWIAAVIIKVLRKKKLAFWTHGLYGNENWLKKKVRCLFYSLADSLLLYGSHAKKLLMLEGFSESKLYVINNSLDVGCQNRIYQENHSSRQRVDAKKFKIIFVGRLTKVKKLNLLLEASRLLIDSFSLEVDIVGDGDQISFLQKISKDFGLEGTVNFHGAVYDEKVLAKLIMCSDVMVSPGNVGLTAMHGLVYGTPVISHANASNQMPEFEAIRPSESGELFTEDNPQSLAESIVRCKENLENGVINEKTCRNVLEQYYSFTYQVRVFEQFLDKGLGVK